MNFTSFAIPVIITLVILVVLLFLNLKMERAFPSAERKMPYRKRSYFLTREERSFYQILLALLTGTSYYAFPKVHLGDILYAPQGTPPWLGEWNRIKNKKLDFVICDDEAHRPLVAIGLEDPAFQNSNKVKWDAFVNKALEDANLPFVKIKAKDAFNLAEITARLSFYLGPVLNEVAVSQEASECQPAEEEENENENENDSENN